MEIQFSEERKPGDPIIEEMQKAAVLLLQDEGLEEERVSISVTFVDKAEIRELNRLYRQKDAMTDVLSVPQYESKDVLPPAGPLLLGDVVICTEQALLQAEEFGHSPERELVYLFVHSLLHLIGCDHEEPDRKRTMREKEERIMSRLGLERRESIDER